MEIARAQFWSERKGVKRIWFSLYTPQEGEQSQERLTPHDRAKVLEELRHLRRSFPLIDMPERVLKGFQDPPTYTGRMHLRADNHLCLL